MEQRSNQLDLKNRMMRIFADQNSCTRTLQSLNPVAGEDFTQVWRRSEDNVNQRLVYSTDPTDPLSRIGVGSSGFLTLTSMRVQGFDPASAVTFQGLIDPNNPSAGVENRRTGNARVVVQLAKPEGTNTNLSFGQGTINFAFDVTVVVRDSDNSIVSCYADRNQYVQAMCESLNGSYDNLDGKCKDLTIETIDPADTEFAIQSWGSMQVEDGVFIGRRDGQDAGGNLIPGFGPGAVGSHGLGVDIAIPARGQISAQKDILSNSGNIQALGGTDPLTGNPTGGDFIAGNPANPVGWVNGGNVLAQNNIVTVGGSISAGIGGAGWTTTLPAGSVNATTSIQAGTSVTAGTTIAATGQGLLPNQDAIWAVAGDINARTGRLIGDSAILRNCIAQGGGTVVADANGATTCKFATTNECPNRIEDAGKTIVVTGFSGYAAGGTPVCKDLFRFQNDCPAGQAAYGYEYVAGSIKVKCGTIGTGCENKIVKHREWIPNYSDPNAPGTWSWISYQATPNNVCENGYHAPLDDYGFRCPGNMKNEEIPDKQPFLYGCETSSQNDLYRVTRFFTYYTCGEPAAFEDNTPKVNQRPCRLGGNKNYRTYKQCWDAGGEVAFYSKAQSSVTYRANHVTARGSNGNAELRENVYVPTILKSGKEEDSYCLIPQMNSARTTGRSMSAVIDSCDSSCDSLRAKVFDDATINAARQCPSPFVKSRDTNNYYYYVVGTTTCSPSHLRQNNTDCTSNYASVAATIVGGAYASTSSQGSQWKGARIGRISGVAAGGSPGESTHVSSLPSTPSGYDTVVWAHGNTPCGDKANGQFHYAEFACYGEITGIACR